MATALEMLAAEKFVKMIAFLKSQACQRVRTNNHVERVNRKLRYEEKVPVQVAEAAHDGAVPGAVDGPVLEARTSDLEPLA